MADSALLFLKYFDRVTVQKIGALRQTDKSYSICKREGKIINKKYQEVFGVARMTATRDLTLLVLQTLNVRINLVGMSIERV